jgi:hypothetical protein
MAHYAEIDSNNVVINVFVGRDENDLVQGVTSWEDYYARPGFTVKRTSYNGKIRGVYAGIGYTYDPDADVFVAPIVEETE